MDMNESDREITVLDINESDWTVLDIHESDLVGSGFK